MRYYPVGFYALLLGLLLAGRSSPGAEAQQAHDFARWEKDISAFEQADRTNPPPKHAFLFIGSSTIRLWQTLPQDFPGKPVLNRGFGGSEILDAAHFADRIVIPYKPDRIFLRSGSNDIHAGKTSEEVLADFKLFVETVHARLPNTDIFYIALCPSVARWNQASQEKTLNTLVKRYSQQTPHVKYIESYDLSLGADGRPRPELFRADKLHFNAAGYKLLAERVRPYVYK